MEGTDEKASDPVFKIRSRKSGGEMEVRRKGDNNGHSAGCLCATLGQNRGRKGT